MKNIGPEEPIEQPITPETRDKALEMLRSRQCNALREVEKLLGWESSMAMGDSLMAQKLGITKWQLSYMIFRDKFQKEAKERLIAEKEARNIKYTTYTSSKLKFSISFPSDWKVSIDRLETEPGPSWEEVYEAFRHTVPDSTTTLEEFKQQAEQPPGQIGDEEAYEKLLEELKGLAMGFEEFKKIYERDKKRAYKEFFKTCPGVPPDEVIEKEYASRDLSGKEAYKMLIKDLETFIVSFEEFKDNYEKDQERRREAERGREELAQMEVGYFEVSSYDDEDYPSVEVTKLKLTRPMTPLELYQLDKPNPEAVPWGNRPSTGITVDSLHGIKYYYILDTGETKVMTEMPRFFNVYLTENKLGWIISCSCKEGVFHKYKPIFTHIVSRFRRT